MNPHNETRDAFRDRTLPVDVRVNDLLSRLTLEEKMSQLLHKTPAVERLGIPSYAWWNECLHGVARNGKATVFPQAIGIAATFDDDLVRRVATAISDEARAKYNYVMKTNGFSAQYQGLTFWTPNINIFRDPRWGRGQETYGEDPYLTSRIGTAFVRGLQGDHPYYLKTAACAKHYAVHSGPEKDRHRFDAVVSMKDLYETYLPAFKALVDAGVESVMGAYNRTNHEPCCGSTLLLEDILRGQWKFGGHVVSDCWAIRDFHEYHGVTDTPAESAAYALTRGCDLNCGCTYELVYLKEALEKKLMTEEHIDAAVRRLFRTRMKLGMFDPVEVVPYSSIGTDMIRCEEHIALAGEAARKSIVLLKNTDTILPLSPDTGSIYVTGPLAMDGAALLGNYHGISDRIVTFLEGIAGAAGHGCRVDYKKGCQLAVDNVNPVDWSGGEAKNNDIVIAIMGLSGELEGEEGDAIGSPYCGDREDIMLPPNQVNYIRKLCSHGKPVVLVLCGGSPVALGDIEDKVAAILHVWYPGEDGGNALADVLFGKCNPSGKLPLTFPRSVDQLPSFDDYSMEGRTYRFMKDDPLFPFGFGLSYTTFMFSDLVMEKETIPAGDSVSCSVRVTNTGNMPGEEVVQLYITDSSASVRTPIHSLCGFRRVMLEPGEYRTVSFTILPEMMSVVRDDGKSVLEPGEFLLYAGGSSPCSRSRELGASAPALCRFEMI